MIVWLYWLYIYIFNWFNSFFQEYVSYHYITNQGDQLTVSTPDVVYTLIIHHTRNGKFYKIVNFPTTDTTFTPSFSWIGLSVYIHDKSYVIPPKEFLFISNILFTPCFNLWLCKHYLNIKATEKVVATMIDKDIDMHTVDYPIMIQETSFEKLI